MKFVDNQGVTDPAVNLAMEEYMVSSMNDDETYLLFYINKPCIIIGKNQNTFEEINRSYVRNQGIPVVRRLSGGGAVYHDYGNLNFSFITNQEGNSFRDFQRFTTPVTDALRELGVDAHMTGRNDIEVDGKKISGNAQFSANGRMFNHGTLMFDVNLDNVSSALNVPADKIQSKGIKSVRGRVANIREYLQTDMTIQDFRQKLLRAIFETSDIPTYKFVQSDWEQIDLIAQQRYRNWDWNYGKSPEFNIRRSKRFPIGSIDIRLDVKNGWIEQCKLYGDFFGTGDMKNIEDRLVTCRYQYDDIREAMQGIDLTYYFGDISLEEFLSLF